MGSLTDSSLASMSAACWQPPARMQGAKGLCVSGAAPQAASARALVRMVMVSLRDDDITAYDASTAAGCQPVTGVG